MERSDPPADGSSALQPTEFGRREVLAATGVALTGCTALGGGASYEKSDFEMEFSVECADGDSEEYAARVSWEWTADEGGSSPGDRVVIYWDERKWNVALPEFETSESVTFEGRGSPGGLDAVVFEHDDESAATCIAPSSALSSSCSNTTASDSSGEPRPSNVTDSLVSNSGIATFHLRSSQ